MFDACIDFDHPVKILGAQALARIIRSGNALEAIQLVFKSCSDEVWQRLRDAVVHELHLSSSGSGSVYQTWKDGSLVHFASESSESTCTLTVAGPRFGRVFEQAQLRSGLGALPGSLRPR